MAEQPHLIHPDDPRPGPPFRATSSEMEQAWRSGEAPTYGDRAVLSWLTELAEGEASAQELELYRTTCTAAGLGDADQDLMDRYFGFHEDGKADVSEIAHLYGIREMDVHQCVRNHSLRIARANQRTWIGHTRLLG